jgi:hypothetical protein
MDRLLNELDVLKDVCMKLEKSGLGYMVTGSLALNYYARPRMTRDIDIVVELKKEEIKRFVEAFSPEYYVSLEAIDDAVSNERMFNIIHNSSIIKVDFIVRQRGEFRLAEFQRRKKVRVDDFDVFLVSKEDLIISKLIWSKDTGSGLQAEDIKNLLITGFDRAYLEEWAKKLGLRELIQEYLK